MAGCFPFSLEKVGEKTLQECNKQELQHLCRQRKINGVSKDKDDLVSELLKWKRNNDCFKPHQNKKAEKNAKAARAAHKKRNEACRELGPPINVKPVRNLGGNDIAIQELYEHINVRNKKVDYTGITFDKEKRCKPAAYMKHNPSLALALKNGDTNVETNLLVIAHGKDTAEVDSRAVVVAAEAYAIQELKKKKRRSKI